MNRDCLGDLVCLHAHQLPSSLLYISQYNPIAFTCGKIKNTSPLHPTTPCNNCSLLLRPSQLFSVYIYVAQKRPCNIEKLGIHGPRPGDGEQYDARAQRGIYYYYMTHFSSLAEPDVPHTLLEGILQSELPSDIFAANISGNDTSPSLVDSMHNLLAMQLEVNAC